MLHSLIGTSQVFELSLYLVNEPGAHLEEQKASWSKFGNFPGREKSFLFIILLNVFEHFEIVLKVVKVYRFCRFFTTFM